MKILSLYTQKCRNLSPCFELISEQGFFQRKYCVDLTNTYRSYNHTMGVTDSLFGLLIGSGYCKTEFMWEEMVKLLTESDECFTDRERTGRFGFPIRLFLRLWLWNKSEYFMINWPTDTIFFIGIFRFSRYQANNGTKRLVKTFFLLFWWKCFIIELE